MSEGERAARFTALYDQYHPRVLAYLMCRAGRHAAEEAASETFVVAWRRLDAIPAAAALPWLLVVARNVVSDSYRKETRRAAVEARIQDWAQAAAQSDHDVADGVVDRALVLRALIRLSDADREVLTLIAWHGLSIGEAATVLGCRPATFSLRLHRARARLRKALTAEANESGGGVAGPESARIEERSASRRTA